MEQYASTYETMKKVYEQVNSLGINAYMIGGISSAIQANIDLYRQNEDLDLMVDIKDLEKITEALGVIGYQIDDRRGHLTRNRVDLEGHFIPADHELNANNVNPNMLGVGIFTFERRDGKVITSSYAIDDRKGGAIIGSQKVMPEELFDLMYDSEPTEYKGTMVKCQTKEYTYMSKSSGTREKDKLDASVIERYIGPEEQKRIERIKKLEKRVEQYEVTYGEDGTILSTVKMPSMEEKIEGFIDQIAKANSGKSPEEIKAILFANERVQKLMEKEPDIRDIMQIIGETQIEGNIAEAGRRIAHDYYYSDELEEKTTISSRTIGKGTIIETEQVEEVDGTLKIIEAHLQELEKEEQTQGE